jgi:hypothetical protein
MGFIKLKNIYGKEIAVNMDMVSEFVTIPETYNTAKKHGYYIILLSVTIWRILMS